MADKQLSIFSIKNETSYQLLHKKLFSFSIHPSSKEKCEKKEKENFAIKK